LIDEKTEGQKSRATIPLKRRSRLTIFKMLLDFYIKLHIRYQKVYYIIVTVVTTG
jgi:hypothetical protein